MTSKLRLSILMVDLLCVPVVLLLAYVTGFPWARGYFWLQYEYFLPLGAVAALCWMIAFYALNLDGFYGGWRLPAVISQVLLGVTGTLVGLSAWAYLGRQMYSRLLLARFTILLLITLVIVRCVARVLVVSRSRTGDLRRAIILGAGNVARELAMKIKTHPELMLDVVGFINPLGMEPVTVPSAPPVTSVPTLAVLDVLRQQRVDELIVVSAESAPQTRKLIASCRAAGIRVSLVPQWYELYISRAELYDIDGLPLISLQAHAPAPIGIAFKYAIDLAIALALLLLTSPIQLAAALLLRVRRSRAFRTETRCGRDGVRFGMYRLNIDRSPANLSHFERFLAETSISELPQLCNVIRGEMSLVGPRPEPPERVQHYSDWQRQRLAVRPGMTGLAQVVGLREEHASEDKTPYDLQYILQASPVTDLALMIQTVWTLISRLSRHDRAAGRERSSREMRSPNVTKPATQVLAETAHADRS